MSSHHDLTLPTALAKAFTLALLAATAGAQTDWVQHVRSAAPGPRNGAAMAFDIQRGRTVLFGGELAGTPSDETWEWDGQAWSQQAPPQKPSARFDHAMAYDLARGVVVLTGGTNGSPIFSDTWEWDGTNWTLRSPAQSAPPRERAAMAYDWGNARMVLFGGAVGRLGPSAETWEWDGVTWSLRGAAGPGPRIDHALAYDGVRGVVVLFGGADQQGQLADTWEWDGGPGTWTLRTPPASPSARGGHGMAWDAARERVVLFGSSNPLAARVDTWEWDGGAGTWTMRTPPTNPQNHTDAALCYDLGRERCVLFGHRGETWEYFTLAPARVTPFGRGCPGTAGTPSLGTPSGRRPWLGDGTFAIEARTLPAGNAAVLNIGFSKTQFQGVPLPLSLGFAGMPGCTLLSSVVVTGTLPGAGSTRTLPLPVPPNPMLVGRTFYGQAVAVDPGANAAGLVLSDALEATIGGR